MGDFFRMSQTIFLSTPFNSGWSEVTARELMKFCLKYKDWSSKEFILFDFAILFDISVVIPIIITIIMNIGRCLQIYLNVLLWSTSFSIFGKLFICGHFIFLLSSISLSQSTINQTSLQVICFCRTLSKINIIITELRCYIIKLYSSFFCSLASSL